MDFDRATMNARYTVLNESLQTMEVDPFCDVIYTFDLADPSIDLTQKDMLMIFEYAKCIWC